jgi:hypothetical protein
MPKRGKPTSGGEGIAKRRSTGHPETRPGSNRLVGDITASTVSRNRSSGKNGANVSSPNTRVPNGGQFPFARIGEPCAAPDQGSIRAESRRSFLAAPRFQESDSGCCRSDQTTNIPADNVSAPRGLEWLPFAQKRAVWRRSPGAGEWWLRPVAPV